MLFLLGVRKIEPETRSNKIIVNVHVHVSFAVSPQAPLLQYSLPAMPTISISTAIILQEEKKKRHVQVPE